MWHLAAAIVAERGLVTPRVCTEMIDAAEQAQQLTAHITGSQLEADRQRRDALLWNFTVIGDAAGQLSAEVKDKFPDRPWQQPRLPVHRPGSGLSGSVAGSDLTHRGDLHRRCTTTPGHLAGN
jgi:hypothetical protein